MSLAYWIGLEDARLSLKSPTQPRPREPTQGEQESGRNQESNQEKYQMKYEGRNREAVM